MVMVMVMVKELSPRLGACLQLQEGWMLASYKKGGRGLWKGSSSLRSCGVPSIFLLLQESIVNGHMCCPFCCLEVIVGPFIEAFACALVGAHERLVNKAHPWCQAILWGHTNAHVRAPCGITTLAYPMIANRMTWRGHVGLEHGRLPHIHCRISITVWCEQEGKKGKATSQMGGLFQCRAIDAWHRGR
jgi:hypothetical protein